MEDAAAVADSDFDMESGVSELGESLFGTESESSQEASQESSQETSETPSTEDLGSEKTTQEASQESSQELRTAPLSWKKEMHDSWGGLTPEVQEYIEQREDQMKEGLEKDRGDANLGKVMRDVMTPYSDMLQQMNIDEPTMVKTMMNAHYRLSTSSPEEKQQLFNQLAQSYGIELGQKEPGKEVDPAIRQLQSELSTIKSSLNAKDKATLQDARQRVETEVEAFASEHPLFGEVEEDLIPFLNSGLSLEDAYEKALWSNPVTRQKEIDRINKESEENLMKKAKQETEAKKKARSTNVRGRDTGRVPTEPLGSMEDTMRDTLANIHNRS